MYLKDITYHSGKQPVNQIQGDPSEERGAVHVRAFKTMKVLPWPRMWIQKGICQLLNISSAIRWGTSPKTAEIRGMKNQWRR